MIVKIVQIQGNRNIGMDLLRLLAMFMVCILHIIGQGGLIDNTRDLSSS